MKCSCGQDDPDRFYRSGKAKTCVSCTQFNLLKVRTGDMEIDRATFLEWRDLHGGVCEYCGIDRITLWELQIPSARNTDRMYEAITIRWVDASGRFDMDNIVACCGPCTSIRGYMLTHEEMKTLGAGIAEVWKKRHGPAKALLEKKVRDAEIAEEVRVANALAHLDSIMSKAREEREELDEYLEWVERTGSDIGPLSMEIFKEQRS